MTTYYERNKERIKEKSRQRYYANKETCLQQNKDWRLNNRDRMTGFTKKWLHSNPEYIMWHNAKRRAKDQRVPFDIHYSDISIPERCPVLGLVLESGVGKSSDNSPSLDKIKPEFGYVKGNICVISSKANRIKSNATVEELCRIIQYCKNQW